MWKSFTAVLDGEVAVLIVIQNVNCSFAYTCVKVFYCIFTIPVKGGHSEPCLSGIVPGFFRVILSFVSPKKTVKIL